MRSSNAEAKCRPPGFGRQPISGRLLTGFAGALTVAACAAGSSPPPVQETAAIPDPAPVTEPAEQAEPAVDQPLPPPPPPKLSWQDLAGLRPAAVIDLMGPPDLVRREGHVQVLLFRLNDCRVDITFYEADGAGSQPGGFAAQHITARDPVGNRRGEAACLAQLDGPPSAQSVAAAAGATEAGDSSMAVSSSGAALDTPQTQQSGTNPS